MKVIVCVDNKGGMAFFQKRQSQDRVLREDILDGLQGAKLWMSPYSLKQFKEENQADLTADEQFLDAAGEEDFCFVENQKLQPYEKKITEIIVYRWNRDYPADLFLDIDLKDWELAETVEFAGNSHEKITKETYQKK
ncbi:ribonuclease Z [Blautia sp. HCP3S3_G3]|uniref:ribonuclease Z n=1 Tax=Blautia sp. HCP3S3_G3 TaxID=3438913 RepID=UPI003F88B645